jgi:hypothetical protein
MTNHRKSVGNAPRNPLDVKLLLLLGDAAPGLLALFAFLRGLLASAQLFATTNRRAIATLIWVFLFGIFWLYLHFRKPWSRGPGEVILKITRPKLRQWLYFVGVLVIIWAPALPWVMPKPQLEETIALEIQRQVSLLEEKTRVADLLYGRMRNDEDSVKRFLKLSRTLGLTFPPPTPYAGLAEELQADLPHFSVTVPQRTAELEAAGQSFRTRARVYRRLEEVEDREREVVTGFRIWWEPYAKLGAWTTPIGTYRRAFQYLIIGVYLRTLRDLQPDLHSIGLSTPAVPQDLAVAKDPIGDADRKRFDQGLWPKFEQSDFVPSEVHCCAPSLVR